MAIKECVICGLHFHSVFSNANVCSHECRRENEQRRGKRRDRSDSITKAKKRERERVRRSDPQWKYKQAEYDRMRNCNPVIKEQRKLNKQKYRSENSDHVRERNLISYYKRKSEKAQANLALTIAIQTGELK